MDEELKVALSNLEGKHVSADITGDVTGAEHFDSFEWWLEHNNEDELVFSSLAQEQYLHIRVGSIANVIYHKILGLYQVVLELKSGMVVQLYNC